MKKPKNPVLVFLTMAFLLLLIILPPYFRKIIPKQEKVITNYDKIVLLTCTKYDFTNKLKAVSKCRYRNGKFESNTISFEKIEVDSSKSFTNNGSLTDEYNFLTSLIKSDTQEEVTIFKIDTSVLRDETVREKIKDYIHSYENQKKTYEKNSYQCTVNKN